MESITVVVHVTCNLPIRNSKLSKDWLDDFRLPLHTVMCKVGIILWCFILLGEK